MLKEFSIGAPASAQCIRSQLSSQAPRSNMRRAARQHKLATDLGADIVAADGHELLQTGGADLLLVTTNDCEAGEKGMAGVRPDGRIVLRGLDYSKPLSIPSDGKPFHIMRQRVVGSTRGDS
ncbi:hypothetical protein [Paracoccus yeei]|uniref:hypothetical protein n=1 Tax=Paracoccus yeei TaxID=147645 RepID=UPI0018E9F0BD|nr:hypothetical protein [Paracoccus yeei]